MKYFCYLLILAGLGTLVACSGAQVLNSLVPHSGYSISQNVAYGEHPRQHLDIYMPDKRRAAGDVIVFFYGGSWQSGNKEDYRFVGQAFASRGYTTVIADYRLYPEVFFPAFMEDGARAFSWVHQHITEYGGNPKRLFLAGHSAGAYIAVMLTVNEKYLNAAGGRPSWIKGTIGLAGPYDFLPFTDPNIKAIFSPEKDVLTQPIHYAAKNLPPMMLATGSDDTQVYPSNTHHLAARLRELGNQVNEYTYPSLAHMGIILSLADGFRDRAPVLDDMDNFISMVGNK